VLVFGRLAGRAAARGLLADTAALRSISR
jgi:hypothetical protein